MRGFHCESDKQDALHNPDRIFKPGEHVVVLNVLNGVFLHAAIYIGNKRVIHVSKPERTGRKRDLGVHEADWQDFHHGNSELMVYVEPIKFRTPEEIVQAAKSQIGQRKGE